MRHFFAVAILLLSLTAQADSLRSDKHFVKIEPQSLARATHQYNVQVFDAETRTHIAHLKVVTNGDVAAEEETVASGVRYKVRVEPHGDAYLFSFAADDGSQVIDTMRGGFVPRTPSKPANARRAGREIDEPKLLRRVEPVYTEEAKAAGAAGSVILELQIDKSGFVRDATVVTPMGHGLSESAVDAAKQWQFAPSMERGVPVEVVYEVTIEFKP
ncbi:MAG TPA: energy transducer TonB [Thermoanaerobaculia bacterium]|nr:energy transducer TonB [Thermoanaerobaculia bacterium]